MRYYVDANIEKVERTFPRQGRDKYYRYDMNENPDGLPEEFVSSVLEEITPEFLSMYPEPDKFLNKYAKFIGAQYDNVLATNGSDMAIRYLLETFGEKGKEVVTVSPSFEMYGVNCNILGLKHISVSYEKNWLIDINKLLKSISCDTRIIVLLNPNNPIGNVYTEEEIKKIIEKAKEVGAVVIVDEAYHYFYDVSFIEYALKEKNVILLRTFSKAFAIAGCRLGVIVSCPEIIQYVKKAKLTFEVNSIALLFGERILDNPSMINNLIETEKIGKTYVLKKLVEHGYECRDCKGNFIFIRPKQDAKKVTKKLEKEKKILVHSYNNEMLKDYIRVSTGSIRMMEIFLKAFFEIDEREKVD